MKPTDTPKANAAWTRYIETGNEEELEIACQSLERENTKLRKALENCLNWTHRAMDLEVSGSMLMAATQHADEARAILSSENPGGMARELAAQDSDNSYDING